MPRHPISTTTRVKIQIRAPRFLTVTVPTGRTRVATMTAAIEKAQARILLHASLPSPLKGIR